MRWVALLVLAALLACCKSKGSAGPATDLDGHAVDPLANVTSTTVLLFVATGCPISNRYAPEIRRLHERFAPRGVKFLLVYPSASESAEDIRKHVREYAYPFAALRDPSHALVPRAGVTVTPEVAVFAPGGELVYRGRIDDRQVDFGKARPEPTRRDLELALDAVLAGRPVETKTAPAIGCSIAR